MRYSPYHSLEGLLAGQGVYIKTVVWALQTTRKIREKSLAQGYPQIRSTFSKFSASSTVDNYIHVFAAAV